jgi:O-methyltransferase
MQVKAKRESFVATLEQRPGMDGRWKVFSEIMRQHVNSTCKSLMIRLGYQLGSASRPVVQDVDFVAATTVEESQYYSQWIAPCPLFSPWLGHFEFQSVYEGVGPYTLVSADRCYILISFARYASHLAGDFAECGVYRGGTALLLARVLQNRPDKRLYLFDSFQGLPKITEGKDQWFREGQFSGARVDAVEELLTDFRSTTEIRCGWIPQTFGGLEDNRYGFVHVDVDLYQSTLDCCNYFYPRLVSGGVLLFDEYGFAAARGEKDAVDEFFADKPECPITLPTGQGLVLKLQSRK